MITRLTETQELIYNKTFDILKNMQDGEEKTLSKNHTSYENFVQCVKHIIDTAQDWNNGFVLTFNSDYSKIKKENRVQFPNKTTK